MVSPLPQLSGPLHINYNIGSLKRMNESTVDSGFTTISTHFYDDGSSLLVLTLETHNMLVMGVSPFSHCDSPFVVNAIPLNRGPSSGLSRYTRECRLSLNCRADY